MDIAALKDTGLIPENSVRVCCIGDGAPWIWGRIREILPLAREILDFYHCSEHLHSLVHLQYDKGSKEVRQ